MNKRIFAAALLAATAAAPAMAADVGVSISVGQPGFYGRINIGDFPRPELVYAQPVVIQPAPVAVVRQPIYLRVPPGHEKNWSKHCGRYGACGQPVYFVRDNWYRDVYVPHYHPRPVVRPVVVRPAVVVHVPPRHIGRPEPRRDDRHDDRRDDRGNGHGNGNGKGHGPDKDHRKD
ncbi:MAG TPA: hypothetical protein VLA16_16635 [Ideonella sp.]|nr:hypothetical protein [Ideonella sp.]